LSLMFSQLLDATLINIPPLLRECKLFYHFFLINVRKPVPTTLNGYETTTLLYSSDAYPHNFSYFLRYSSGYSIKKF
ncbi:hypothetical protein, partial [Sporosarcina sp. P29]|uniref:hypothetical protein n=1 Tax=Sporosarcina sp. P29 TaxID=2048252 RepID=UPI001E47B573